MFDFGRDPARRRRIGAIAFAAALMAGTAFSAPLLGQDDGVTFPVTTSGEWAGVLELSGHLSSDSVSDNGSFNVKNTDVMGATKIELDFMVAADGTVSGTMPVFLVTFSESAGAASNGDPFHLLTDKITAGTLTLSGNASRFVAAGELEESTSLIADGELVEEVSGTKTRSVEWVFSVAASDCLRVTAPLLEASGRTLVGSSLLPREAFSGDTKINNSLKAELNLWPKSGATSANVTAAEDEVTALADELQQRTIPLAEHLLNLIDAWIDMQAEIAALNECDPTVDFIVSSLDKAWLATSLQRALKAAGNSADSYEAQELIDLWDVGAAESLLDGELVVEYLDALDDMLDDAITSGDMQTISEIAAFAEAEGYPGLKAKADGASS